MFIWEFGIRDKAHTSTSIVSRWLPTLVLLLSASVFLAITSIRELSLDEAATLGFVRADFGDYLNVVIRSYDAVHATYYLLVRPLADLPIPWIRAISGISMALATYFSMKIAMRLSGRRTAIATGLALPAIPLALEAAATARSFALACFLGTWSWWLFIRLLTGEASKKTLVITYICVSALAMIVFIMSILLLLGQIIQAQLIQKNRQNRKRLFLYQILSLGPPLPVFALAYMQRSQLAGAEGLTPSSLMQVPSYFFGYGLFGISRVNPALSWGLAILAIILAVKGIQASQSQIKRYFSINQVAFFWSVVPLLFVSLSSLVTPLLSPRYLIILTPAIALLIGQGLSQLTSQAWRAIFVVGWLTLLSIIAFQLFRPAGIDGWGQKSAIIKDRVGVKDAVIFAPDLYGVMAQQTSTVIPLVLDQSVIAAGELAKPEYQNVDGIWVVPYVPSDLVTGSSNWLPTALRDLGFVDCKTFQTDSGPVLFFARNNDRCSP